VAELAVKVEMLGSRFKMSDTFKEYFDSEINTNDRYISHRSRSGFGYKEDGVIKWVFAGHPVNYREAGQWKPITLYPDNDRYEGSRFGFNGSEVCYDGAAIFKPNTITFNGVVHKVQLSGYWNKLYFDVPNLGLYEVAFTEFGVRETLTIPEPVDGVLSFDTSYSSELYGLSRSKRFIVESGEDVGDTITLTKDMVYPITIDPTFTAYLDKFLYTQSSVSFADAYYSTSYTGAEPAPIIRVYSQYNAATWYIGKSGIKFDTSSLSSKEPEKVNLSLYGYGLTDSVSPVTLLIKKFNWDYPATNRAIADAMLSATNDSSPMMTLPTSYVVNHRITSGDLDTAWVNNSGYTQYGLVSSVDNSGVEFSTLQAAYGEFSAIADVDPAKRPYLLVEQSTKETDFFMML
jgi:hypothetical protein